MCLDLVLHVYKACPNTCLATNTPLQTTHTIQSLSSKMAEYTFLLHLLTLVLVQPALSNSTYEQPAMTPTRPSLVSDGQDVKPLYIIVLLPYSEPWPSGPAVRHVEEIALRHINENPNVLAGYELRAVWEDTEVSDVNDTEVSGVSDTKDT